MRLGLIARAENTGLSTQTWEFAQHMHPAKTLLVDMSRDRGRPFRPDLYPDAAVSHGAPTRRALDSFLDSVDVVFTAETAYSNDLYLLARQRGVKVVLQPNYEFLDRTATPDLWAAPSLWHFDELPDPKTHLPVPIATERFPPRPTPERATRFLHIVGRPAIHGRNGTEDLLKALQHVHAPVSVTIRCQDPGYVTTLLRHRDIPAHVTLGIDCADLPNYWDAYDSDVLVMPRRFGGLCLPAQEALAAGMPVIMPAVSPNDWLPSEWLVPATHAGRFTARVPVDLYTVDHEALASKIDQLATDTDFYGKAAALAGDIADQMSWERLKPMYDQTFAELIA
ncbi:glycosyltransferase [Nocardia otitidiscaviarum]|uniref:glycosyltransferase n=1 Tax=Nocardia otitidiscaviarum TaxID=1823 RepID=UPI0004A73CFD|nr:hypothetical protein [Nocardia otitidiscaviarum]